MRRVFLAACAMLGVATGGAAQQSVGPDVTVVAKLPPAKEMVKQLTRSITPLGESRSMPLPRFSQTICPGVVGIADPYAGLVKARIREDAQAARIPVGDAGCRPNIMLVVTPDGQALVRELHRIGSPLFGDLTPTAIRRIVDRDGPVRYWTLTQFLSRDGDLLKTPASGEPGTLKVRDASILTSPERIDIIGAIVVIDSAATLGKTLNQLADYAAMRGLARTGALGDRLSNDTILTLFDRADAPKQLTGFDIGYLRALYHGLATMPGGAKLHQMADAISHDGGAASAKPAAR